eukprot:scaffold57508_cov81-Phaeocystis_antarctica.AAC.5
MARAKARVRLRAHLERRQGQGSGLGLGLGSVVRVRVRLHAHLERGTFSEVFAVDLRRQCAHGGREGVPAVAGGPEVDEAPHHHRARGEARHARVVRHAHLQDEHGVGTCVVLMPVHPQRTRSGCRSCLALDPGKTLSSRSAASSTGSMASSTPASPATARSSGTRKLTHVFEIRWQRYGRLAGALAVSAADAIARVDGEG